jgi:DUF1680 family protein
MISYPPGATFHYPYPGQISLAGRLSARCLGNRKYLQSIYETRKDWMLEPFRNRGQEWVLEPLRIQKGELAWAGEYAGKWLDAACRDAAGSQDEQFLQYVAEFAAELVACQEPDGYLGIEVPAKRGFGWDVWNIWNVMLGLLTHFEIFNIEASFEAAKKCGKWLIDRFGMISDSNNPFFSSAHDPVCTGPIIQEFNRLYRITREEIFLDFVSSVVNHYPPMDQVRNEGKAPLVHVYHLAEFLAGVVDLAVADQRTVELQGVESVWQDMVERHLYPTGSLGFREHLRETAPNDIPVENGQPDKHHQETCATTAWLLLNSRLYLATGKVRYIQCMEQTIYNALLAAQSIDGMQWMYYTPLRYEKRWFSGPTSCCYWSGPRGVARLPEWVYALDGEGILVNLYESSTANFHIDGKAITIEQSSAYPERGHVFLQVDPEAPVSFPLRLRIPDHGEEIQITLNNERITAELEMDGYFSVHRKWFIGDHVQLDFDIPVAVHNFLNDQYGVVQRGPEVLAVDQRDNASLDLDRLEIQRRVTLRSANPVDGRRRYVGEVVSNGQMTPVCFTPYADAGGDQARFRTAFPVG